MMPSNSERRTLNDIERRLLSEDPASTRRFDLDQRKLVPAAHPVWLHHCYTAGAALAAALSTIMIFAGIPSLTAFFLLLMLGLLWALERPEPHGWASSPGGDSVDKPL